MHKMRTTAIDVPGVCKSVMWLHCATVAEWIDVLAVCSEDSQGPRNVVFRRGCRFSHDDDHCATQEETSRSCLRWRLLGTQGTLYYWGRSLTARGFDAAFAKLLWTLLLTITVVVAVAADDHLLPANTAAAAESIMTSTRILLTMLAVFLVDWRIRQDCKSISYESESQPSINCRPTATTLKPGSGGSGHPTTEPATYSAIGPIPASSRVHWHSC